MQSITQSHQPKASTSHKNSPLTPSSLIPTNNTTFTSNQFLKILHQDESTTTKLSTSENTLLHQLPHANTTHHAPYNTHAEPQQQSSPSTTNLHLTVSSSSDVSPILARDGPPGPRPHFHDGITQPGCDHHDPKSSKHSPDSDGGHATRHEPLQSIPIGHAPSLTHAQLPSIAISTPTSNSSISSLAPLSEIHGPAILSTTTTMDPLCSMDSTTISTDDANSLAWTRYSFHIANSTEQPTICTFISQSRRTRGHSKTGSTSNNGGN
ncbi:hypothetical protein A4A49_28655 [Nicotiana attenuata]|uniref:Uncharacterized protein n=1 Tax=Nicotiana attenuata TaxID=49451 RepID=A0A1J6JZK8_NICAT|nr:hypothetical protein A4A49_28655 [Nicotiana attenuata]